MCCRGCSFPTCVGPAAVRLPGLRTKVCHLGLAWPRSCAAPQLRGPAGLGASVPQLRGPAGLGASAPQLCGFRDSVQRYVI